MLKFHCSTFNCIPLLKDCLSSGAINYVQIDGAHIVHYPGSRLYLMTAGLFDIIVN